MYAIPREDSKKQSYVPALKEPNLRNSLLLGLSLHNGNVKPVLSIDYLSPKDTIIDDSAEDWEYRIEYEHNGKMMVENRKPEQRYRIPNDTLVEILFSYLAN